MRNKILLLSIFQLETIMATFSKGENKHAPKTLYIYKNWSMRRLEMTGIDRESRTNGVHLQNTQGCEEE